MHPYLLTLRDYDARKNTELVAHLRRGGITHVRMMPPLSTMSDS
jgi:hypothetical protein